MARSSGVTLEAGSARPLWEQIFDQYVARIQSGALGPGARLPPTRELARELGTHRNTVVRAFEELAAAGFVESTVGRGTFVLAQRPGRAELAPEAKLEHAPLGWGGLLSRGATAPELSHEDRLGQVRTGRGGFIDLQRFQPAPDLLPIDLFRRSLDHVLRRDGHRVLGYAPREGAPRLREAICRELDRDGLHVEPDDLLVTSGSQQGLDLVIRALLDPQDCFLVEEPTYMGAIRLLASHGAKILGVPSTGGGPDLAALERLAGRRPKGLYLMPSGRNPTGAMISLERRHELVRWSHAAGVPLIEDDYVADLALDPGPRPATLRALDADVIYMASFSKKLIPALRLGYLICPRPLRPHVVRLKQAADLGSSLLLQLALAEFLDRGYLRAHLSRTLPEYRRRREALLSALQRELPTEVRVTGGPVGFSVWIEIPPRLDPELVFAQAAERGVLLSPGSLCSVDGTGAAGARLTFCNEPPARLAEGAARLGRLLKELLGARPRRAEREGVVFGAA